MGVSKDTSVSTAIDLFDNMHVSLLPVIDNRVLVGILYRDRVSREFYKLKVDKIMDLPVFIDENTEIEIAAKKMFDMKVTRLPVVDNEYDRICVGLVTSTELAHYVRGVLT